MSYWKWSSSTNGTVSSSCPSTVVRSSCPKTVVYTYTSGQSTPQAPNQSVPSVPSSSSTSSSSSSSVEQFEQDCLDEHNRLRRLHGSPPLKLSKDLCAYAREWAEYNASRNTFNHRQPNKYGENMYMSDGCGVDARVAVKSWYDEIAYYNYGRPGFNMKTGHFTQVVWKSTQRMGVGFAKRGTKVYVVANYDPPGNVGSQFRENVLQRS